MEWIQVVEILKEVNIAQLIVIGMMFWFFYKRVDAKFEKIDARFEKMDEKIDKVEKSLGNRIDKLSEKVEDIDRRLCRIEGSLATQGSCLFNQAHKEKLTG